MAFHPSPYENLEDEEIKDQFDQIIVEWQAFLLSQNLSIELGKDYFIHKRNLTEVIIRCDKRRVYMEMFHKLEHLSEYKIIAMETFWINTLKPFMVVNDDFPIYNCPNEMFSLYRILATIRGVYEDKNKDKSFIYPTPKRIQDILYDLKYCSFNRESMIAFVETLADKYGVGIDYILSKKEVKK